MPGNNRKALDSEEIRKLNDMYSFMYDPTHNQIIIKNSTNKRSTIHDADKKLIINCVRYNHVIVFNKEAIELFKKFSNDNELSKYSLIDINNTINKLIILYQPIDEANVIKALQNL